MSKTLINAVRIRYLGAIAEVDVIKDRKVIKTVKTTVRNAKFVQNELHKQFWDNSAWIPF